MAQPCVIISEKGNVTTVTIRRSVGKALVNAGVSKLTDATETQVREEILTLLTLAREQHGSTQRLTDA